MRCAKKDRFVVVADLHIEDVRDTYVMKEIFALCRKERARLVIDGDVFTQCLPRAEIFVRFCKMLRAAAVEAFIIMGNHDVDVSSALMEALHDPDAGIRVIAKPFRLRVSGKPSRYYLFLPWPVSGKIVLPDSWTWDRATETYAFGHLDLQGACLGGGGKERVEKGVILPRIPHLTGGIFGDIHLPQSLPLRGAFVGDTDTPVWVNYVGSARSVKSNERHVPRAALVYDGKVREWPILKTASRTIVLGVKCKKDAVAVLRVAAVLPKRHRVRVMDLTGNTTAAWRNKAKALFSKHRAYIFVSKGRRVAEAKARPLSLWSAAAYLDRDPRFPGQHKALYTKVGNAVLEGSRGNAIPVL